MNGRLEKAFMVIASLWGVVRTLAQRPRVIVFGNDMLGTHSYEPRMARVYEWLDARHVPYAHLVHAAPHGRVVRHWFRRRGPVLYLEGLERIHPSLLRRLLRWSGARQLLAIDDYRHWPRVVGAAHGAGMRTLIFQHGRFTRHQSYLAFPGVPLRGTILPDAYIVWNDYWREQLLRLSPPFAARPDIVRVGGKPSGNTIRSGASQHPNSLVVVFVHEPAASPREVRGYLEALLSVPEVSIRYKVRPDRSREEQLAGLGAMAANPRFSVVGDVPHDAAVGVGSYSSLLYELIEQGIPVGVLVMASTQADDLVSEGLAATVDLRAPDIAGQLRAAAMISDDERRRRSGVLRVDARIEATLSDLLNA